MCKDLSSLGAGRFRKRVQEEREKRMNGNMVRLTGDMGHDPAARGRSLGVSGAKTATHQKPNTNIRH